MSLAQTRPESSQAMTELVYALRDAVAARAMRGELNIAESVNAMAQAVASILVGAYDQKNREIVLSMFPDVVRAYYQQWEEIYAAHGRSTKAEGTTS